MSDYLEVDGAKVVIPSVSPNVSFPFFLPSAPATQHRRHGMPG